MRSGRVESSGHVSCGGRKLSGPSSELTFPSEVEQRRHLLAVWQSCALDTQLVEELVNQSLVRATAISFRIFMSP
jgi:hypothetical protein